MALCFSLFSALGALLLSTWCSIYLELGSAWSNKLFYISTSSTWFWMRQAQPKKQET